MSKHASQALGASSHSKGDRQLDDFYATDPNAIDDLLGLCKFNTHIWENACGQLHLSKRLKKHGHKVYSTDLIKRHKKCNDIIDFLKYEGKWKGDIITNPPYKHATKWLEKSLDAVNDNNKIALFLKLTFLEGKARHKIFKEHPPKFVFVYSNRAMCMKDAKFDEYKGSTIAYAWFVWEKGFKGKTQIDWILQDN